MPKAFLLQPECLHPWHLHRLEACHSAGRASVWLPAFSGRVFWSS